MDAVELSAFPVGFYFGKLLNYWCSPAKTKKRRFTYLKNKTNQILNESSKELNKLHTNIKSNTITITNNFFNFIYLGLAITRPITKNKQTTIKIYYTPKPNKNKQLTSTHY